MGKVVIEPLLSYPEYLIRATPLLYIAVFHLVVIPKLCPCGLQTTHEFANPAIRDEEEAMSQERGSFLLWLDFVMNRQYSCRRMSYFLK